MQYAPVIGNLIATEINADLEQVQAAIQLIDSGATIPFIARYRKEVTGKLTNVQLRVLEDRLFYLRDINARRGSILKSIRERQKLTDELEAAINAATTKAELEDLCLPYRPHHHQDRAQKARDKGLGFLAEAILNNRLYEPEELAVAYINNEVSTIAEALEGARDIITEEMAENAELISRLRRLMHNYAYVRARVHEGKEKTGIKFSDYFDYREKWAKIPSHQALALMRGRNDGVLSLNLELESKEALQRVYETIHDVYYISDNMPGDVFLATIAHWAWDIKLSLHLEIDLFNDLRERADKDAIQVFSRNLKTILLAPPAGPRPTLGLDPGLRNGIKMAAIDAAGNLSQTETIFPFEPHLEVEQAKETLKNFILSHRIEMIAIGNGTASRETERFVHNLLAEFSHEKRPKAVIISESGISLYSASAEAIAEFPDLDATLRGAVSIARRLQNPLVELVKLSPRLINVGQYQHDVDQYRLSRALDSVMEDAVNAVGVDVNTASAALLSHVSGLDRSVADAIIVYREKNGPFKNREELKKVPYLDEKRFEQCAGFLRIYGGDEPLDTTAIHPETYPLARRIAEQSDVDIHYLIGNRLVLRNIDKIQFVDAHFGLATVEDVFFELEKPSHDPRPAFKSARMIEATRNIADLHPGMAIEGKVTNVTTFGVFVNIGVGEDALVHISELPDHYVQNLRRFLKTGDVITVRIKAVDPERQRITLTMRQPIDDQAKANPATSSDGSPPPIIDVSLEDTKMPDDEQSHTMLDEEDILGTFDEMLSDVFNEEDEQPETKDK